MRVFILGGYGKTGPPAARLLAQSGIVTEITIAGRTPERATAAAAELSANQPATVGAILEPVDGTDAQALTAATVGYDLIINAATNDCVIPCIRAGIANGAHYCDMAWAGILDEAAKLDPIAKAAGSTAVVATGISPCLTNLMGVHTASQLDEVKQLQLGRAEVIDFSAGTELVPDSFRADPTSALAALQHYAPYLTWMLSMVKDGTRTVVDWADDAWIEIDPLEAGLSVPRLPGGPKVARPFLSCSSLFGTLPTGVAKTEPVEAYFTPLPPDLDAAFHAQALRVRACEVDNEAAMAELLAMVEADPARWLTLPEGYVPPAKIWARALGTRDGRPARADCWFTPPHWDITGYYLTSVALVAAALTVLRGEVPPGVATAEQVLDPCHFFDAVAGLLGDALPDGTLLNESIEWLD